MKRSRTDHSDDDSSSRPTDIDCLSGNSNFCRQNPGTLLFWRLVSESFDEHESADAKSDFLAEHGKRDRSVIKQEVATKFRKTGGRFLKKIRKTNRWQELTEKEVNQKLVEAFKKIREERKRGASALRAANTNGAGPFALPTNTSTLSDPAKRKDDAADEGGSPLPAQPTNLDDLSVRITSVDDSISASDHTIGSSGSQSWFCPSCLYRQADSAFLRCAMCGTKLERSGTNDTGQDNDAAAPPCPPSHPEQLVPNKPLGEKIGTSGTTVSDLSDQTNLDWKDESSSVLSAQMLATAGDDDGLSSCSSPFSLGRIESSKDSGVMSFMTNSTFTHSSLRSGRSVPLPNFEPTIDVRVGSGSSFQQETASSGLTSSNGSQQDHVREKRLRGGWRLTYAIPPILSCGASQMQAADECNSISTASTTPEVFGILTSLSLMKDNLDNVTIQVRLSGHISHFLWYNDDFNLQERLPFHSKTVASELLEVILRAMRVHNENVKVQRNAVSVVEYLCCKDCNIAYNMIRLGGVFQLLLSMRLFLGHADVQRRSLSILQTLNVSPLARTEIQQAGGVDLINCVRSIHGSCREIDDACETLLGTTGIAEAASKEVDDKTSDNASLPTTNEPFARAPDGSDADSTSRGNTPHTDIAISIGPTLTSLGEEPDILSHSTAVACIHCGDMTYRRCSRCHRVAYCSNRCGKRHRTQHLRTCRFPDSLRSAVADLLRRERQWLLYDMSHSLREHLARDLYPDSRGNISFHQTCTSLHVVGVVLGILPAFWMTRCPTVEHSQEFFLAVLIPWFEAHRTSLEERGLTMKMIRTNLEGPCMFLTSLGYTNTIVDYRGRYILWNKYHKNASTVVECFMPARESTAPGSFTIEQGFECMLGFPLSPVFPTGERWSISFFVSNVDEIYRVNYSDCTAIMTTLPNVDERDAVNVGKLFRRLFLAYDEVANISLQMVIEPLQGWTPGSIAALLAIASVSRQETDLVSKVGRAIERGVIEFTDIAWWEQVLPNVAPFGYREERRRRGQLPTDNES